MNLVQYKTNCIYILTIVALHLCIFLVKTVNLHQGKVYVCQTACTTSPYFKLLNKRTVRV